MPTDDGAWRQDQEAETVVPTDEYIQRITPVQRGEAGGGWGNEKVETSAEPSGAPMIGIAVRTLVPRVPRLPNQNSASLIGRP